MSTTAKIQSLSSAEPHSPFVSFAPPIRPQSELRKRITDAYRRPEPECLPGLIEAATLPAETVEAAAAVASKLVETLRSKSQGGAVQGLVREYALSSQEGVALMCLAEALLRIPDAATRDALIRDKIAPGDWRSHLGNSPSLFVNAATWGLMVTGKLTSAASEQDLASALTRLVARCGEPVIRKGVDIAMRLMGEEFVKGQTIDEAIEKSRKFEAEGFRYSYDMLGEAATTAEDAARYYKDYETAIHAIGKASAGRGIYKGPGISIKLSALHPRYSRAQADRVMGGLLPKVKALALLSRRYDIGLNIDAEEADRLEISLDLMEELCFDPDLAGWNGIGFVVQAYGKRCPAVIDFLIDLARRSRHRLMVRLVKGAYWDAEIKRAQVDGLEDFPVYTRKVYTDVSYVACARKLLGAPDAIFPQFATHNALTLATILKMAGDDYHLEQYEFQCLHGMGEPLYEEVVGEKKLGRPCRIYAPVGTHETLLAYLVRRLLENGANSSFVNRIADKNVPVSDLVANPVDVARSIVPLGAPHLKIALPKDLYGSARKNSSGIDLSNENELAALSRALVASADVAWSARPLTADGEGGGPAQPVLNPADQRDQAGTVIEASPDVIASAFRHAAAAAKRWAETPAAERVDHLNRAADIMQGRMLTLMGLIVREAGKSIPNSIAEVREAIDFLRYYAAQARDSFKPETHQPVGPVVCISPWNFPLAIFTGQIAAALAAGNPVLAKPAEETPLIAAQAVRILREAGIPADVIQLLPGAGDVGAALVANAETRAVMFTGSTEVARLIQRQLADRLSPSGHPIPLIAETGGQNAMIVDSSALAEQVVGDVISSAFDSAGQRCSALRILCLQEEIADRTLTMLKGAVHELRIGNPDRLSTDIGPVITKEAQQNIAKHVQTMAALGHQVEAASLPEEAQHGTFLAPTFIEVENLNDVKREVFGPVLHVMRYRRENLDALIDEINGKGYGLTFGLHTRIDETVERVTSRIEAGNLYINRNIIGAIVGVQPFGGRGLSGTGPKAGGPLYMLRLLSKRPKVGLAQSPSETLLAPARAYRDWLAANGHASEAKRAESYLARSPLGISTELPGPVGERNVYTTSKRGRVLLYPETETGLLIQIAAALATGNEIEVDAPPSLTGIVNSLPASLKARISTARGGTVVAALVEGDAARVREINGRIAGLEGPIALVQGASSEGLASGAEDYCLDWLIEETSISTNTAAAGGNASLMTIG
ncbi:trifunctional transcriptional regulator/proline dehydrogenase/L-glutamate gamma-semialdehyde dehydrogenase [Microvirga flavescens]|uniref:trifunctional transcriptional regulator/proline dehydrogenase/L-glutamate gamma-semialdehyde dehydrogenase n=1 Tax=Microvirga flavescens TaxID=2249811 RepID=UPI000DDBF024|nr:trifunctional transcriptional regulator/proline dehydrogenase/L-glutamate gamma-semialdehyde dehydrogenase [Microvirga flavescens]